MQLWLGHRRLATTARYLCLATTKVCATTSPLDLLPCPGPSPATSPVAVLDDPFASETAAVRADVWPEVAEAPNWQAEQTNATAYGWGQGLRPEQQKRPSTEDDDDPEGSTVVGSTKPR